MVREFAEFKEALSSSNRNRERTEQHGEGELRFVGNALVSFSEDWFDFKLRVDAGSSSGEFNDITLPIAAGGTRRQVRLDGGVVQTIDELYVIPSRAVLLKLATAILI